MTTQKGTLLLYLPVPVHRRDGVLCLEDQACNGLRLWAEHFDRLIVMIPETTDGDPPEAWIPITSVGPAFERIEMVILPEAWRPDRFFRLLPSQLPRIRDAIGRADWLGFAIGGLFGDWGSVAAWAAHRMGKPFYIWTDRVESEVAKRTVSERSRLRRLTARFEIPLMAWNERALIRRSALGLFHGRETFEHYAPYASNPQLVHDIHLARADHIGPDALAAKRAASGAGPLRVVYAGRAAEMKGPMDWLNTLENLTAQGVDVRATWLGDGPDLDAMQERVANGPLAGLVDLPGFVNDREALISALRNAHILMFCHKTPESPRVLIEALVSGTPIVGYDSAFPADLIADHGGGILVPRDAWDQLAEAVATLARDRQRLTDLMARAVADGAPYDDETVFEHRSDVIKTQLPRAR